MCVRMFLDLKRIITLRCVCVCVCVCFNKFGNCFVVCLQLSFVASTVVFCFFCSCFMPLETHSMINFNCPTAHFYGSCFLLARQLFFDLSAVVFC